MIFLTKKARNEGAFNRENDYFTHFIRGKGLEMVDIGLILIVKVSTP